MKKNKLVSIIAISIIVVAGAFFYGGMKYAQAKGKNTMRSGNFRSQNGMGVRPDGAMMRSGANGGFTSGEVIAKDATSMTVKLQDGGSKIILFTATTPVMKSIAGTSEDIAIGKNVMITGKVNADGSVSAEQIQLRDTPVQPLKIN